MRNNADNAKRDKAAAIASMSDIEAKAKQQYERDVQEGEEAMRNLTGSWVSLCLKGGGGTHRLLEAGIGSKCIAGLGEDLGNLEADTNMLAMEKKPGEKTLVWWHLQKK